MKNGRIEVSDHNKKGMGVLMSQSDVMKVRRAIDNRIGSKVKIRANRGRHKIDISEGVISETYPNIFLVKVENKFDATFQTVSYSYTDVLTKDVQMTLLCN